MSRKDQDDFDYDDEEEEEEPLLSLGSEALEALQSVLGVGLDTLQTLITSRRCDVEDEDNDEVDDSLEATDQDNSRKPKLHEMSNMNSPKESHAEYYKRLFPERYLNSSDNLITSVDPILHPVSFSVFVRIQRRKRKKLILSFIFCLYLMHISKVAVVTVEDDYVKNIILNAFRNDRPHWQVLTQLPIDNQTIYHFHWGEYEHIEWFSKRFHAEEILVSCYYNRKGLIRKAKLAKILEKWHAKYKEKRLPIAPKSYILRLPIRNTIPTTADDESISEEFILAFEEAIHESGFPGFQQEENYNTRSSNYDEQSGLREESEVWILKPSITNQAIGISLVTSMDQLRTVLYNSDPIQLAGDFVLQTYLPPLLIDGRKFHLRVFMILVGHVTAYVDPQFLAIFSLRQYIGALWSDTRAHLTNIAHQDVQSIEDQHRCMRLLDETMQDMIDSSLVHNMEEAKNRVSYIQQRVYDIISEMVDAVTSELTFSAKNNCFEIFGLDFMIDDDWGVWLLEANAEPDLSKAGDRLQHVIDRMLLNTLSVVLDNDVRFPYCSSGCDEKNHLVKVFDRRGRSY